MSSIDVVQASAFAHDWQTHLPKANPRAQRKTAAEYGAGVTEAYAAKNSASQAINKAFLIAHLLTASVEQAGNAVAEALATWNPGEDNEEALFQDVLTTAVRGQVEEPSPGDKSDSAGSLLPGELQAILGLSLQLRRCFVLRILAGLSVQVCARLLQMHPRRVNQYTCAALQCLPLQPGI